MKKTIYIFIIVFFFARPGFSQFQDDFSDGNISENPEWLGDMGLFVVNAGELQLFDTEAGSSNETYLSSIAATSTDENTVWEFYFRLDFSPSTSNYAKIWLTASNFDLTGEQNGYFLKTGGISGNDDALELYRQDGNSTELLISGSQGSVGQNPAIARVKISRSTTGEWQLSADYSGGEDYQIEGTAIDDTYPLGNYFGIICKYSSTRWDKFFFDDFFIDPLYVDGIPPVLLNITPVSSTELTVKFDEPLEASSAQNTSNYIIEGFGTPVSAVLEGNLTTVNLIFDNDFESQQNYTLAINNILDVSGNNSGMQSSNFIFYEVEQADIFDILINEIMADPSPPVALPEVEFVELYNRSDKIIDLEGFGFSSGGSPKILPSFLLFPDSYVIICDDSDENLLTGYGDVLSISGFPALTNSKDELTLFDPQNNIIHYVNYSIDWYGSDDKNEGGWTLELINPSVPCDLQSNWSASENLLGGTPGQPNSILDNFVNGNPPHFVDVFVDRNEPYEVHLFFDKAMDDESVLDAGNYVIDNGINVESVFSQHPLNISVVLILDSPLNTGVIYSLKVLTETKDCIGNPINSNSIKNFGLPELPDIQDIVINEILFNPQTGGKDFIELYNRSGKILNTGEFLIGNISETDSDIIPVWREKLFFPGDFMVFTSEPSDIKNRYTVTFPENLIEQYLPPFSNDAGNVTVLCEIENEAVVIDAFDYSEEFHYPLLNDVDGVSLERINPGKETQSTSNWQSAAKSAGYATPTGKNSQFFNEQNESDDIFHLPKKTFSPDSDGFEDYLLINYTFESSGYSANVKIFDVAGRQIKDLINNELLASEGSFKWEGETDAGRKARIGIYFIWIEVFSPEGGVDVYKKTCVLAGKI